MEPVDAIQHLAERLPRHSRLSELEHQPPDVAHQPASGLDELDLRASPAVRRYTGTEAIAHRGQKHPEQGPYGVCRQRGWPAIFSQRGVQALNFSTAVLCPILRKSSVDHHWFTMCDSVDMLLHDRQILS